MKYRNKYFEKIGYDKPFSQDVLCKYRKDKTDKRYKLFKKQRAKYGRWDETCTWALNTFIAESLYTWLNMYVDIAARPTHTYSVNLDYYSFEIELDGVTTTKTELEWIVEALSLIKEYLLTVDSFDPPAEEFGTKCMEKALIIIGKIFPALWW